MRQRQHGEQRVRGETILERFGCVSPTVACPRRSFCFENLFVTLCCKIKTLLSILCREAVLRTYAPAVSRVTVNMVYVPVDSNQEVVHAPCGALGATYFP